MEKGEFNIVDKDFDIEKCKEAAKKGNPEAQHSLAVCYWWGYHGLDKDAKKAFRLASKAAEKGLPEALDFLGDCYRDGKKVTMADSEKAFECYKKAAEQDYTEAICDLGECYLKGFGTEQNVEKGIELLREAADRGFGIAFRNLANYYLSLDDNEKAFELFKKGKELGDSKSETMLGLCYLEGVGTSEDVDKGIDLLAEAADDEDEDAINILAEKFQEVGEYEKAFEFYKKGQLLENAESQTGLGLCYLKGIGTAQDPQEAFNLIEDAAIRFNYSDAWFWLSCFYADGVVVGRNQKKADLYYQKAIENGYVEPTSNTKQLKDYYNENDDTEIDFSQLGSINYNKDKEKIQSCIVYIENHSGDGNAYTGSGFIISPDGYVATCAHVIEDDEELYVKVIGKNKKKKAYKAMVIKANPETDTAIIKIENVLKLPFVELDDREEAELGEDIVIYGYPLGGKLNDDVFNLNISFAKGNVSSNQIKNELKRTMLDISAKHGNSGSPIISCKTGKVIGILRGCVLGQEAGDEVNDMMPVCYLHELLHELEEEKKAASKKANKSQDEPRLDAKPLKKWADVKRFLRNEYKVAKEDKDFLTFEFELENNRSQLVCVERAETQDGIQWIMVSSCVGLIDDSEIDEVLKMVGEYAFGGLVKTDDKHFVRYSLLLESASELSLLRPINTIAQLADEIEEKYIGGDQY